jgi:hypothetical protein
VYVVGHPAVADHFYPVQGNALPQQLQIDVAIGVAGKDKLACISTLGNVMGYSDCNYPGETRHASYLNGWIDFFGDSAERVRKLAKLLVRYNKAVARTTSIMQHLE